MAALRSLASGGADGWPRTALKAVFLCMSMACLVQLVLIITQEVEAHHSKSHDTNHSVTGADSDGNRLYCKYIVETKLNKTMI